jgi:FKBP-type peptidyl-prolyl cis-trans isomerase FkpA
MKNFFVVCLALVAILMFACEDLTPCDAADQELQIQQYLQENNLTAERDSSGLYYIIEEPGSRIRPNLSSTVSVIYRGYLTDKDTTEFDSSKGNPRTFPLAGVVKGWQIGIPLFREGGKGKLFVPCNLGYGDRQSGLIPPGSVLIFDIELVDVQ